MFCRRQGRLGEASYRASVTASYYWNEHLVEVRICPEMESRGIPGNSRSEDFLACKIEERMIVASIPSMFLIAKHGSAEPVGGSFWQGASRNFIGGKCEQRKFIISRR